MDIKEGIVFVHPQLGICFISDVVKDTCRLHYRAYDEHRIRWRIENNEDVEKCLAEHANGAYHLFSFASDEGVTQYSGCFNTLELAQEASKRFDVSLIVTGDNLGFWACKSAWHKDEPASQRLTNVGDSFGG